MLEIFLLVFLVNICAPGPVPEPFFPNIFNFPGYGQRNSYTGDNELFGTSTGFNLFKSFPFDNRYPFPSNPQNHHYNQPSQNPFDWNTFVKPFNDDDDDLALFNYDDDQVSAPSPIFFHSSSSPNHHQVIFSVHHSGTKPIHKLLGSEQTQGIHETVKGVLDNFFTSLFTAHKNILKLHGEDNAVDYKKDEILENSDDIVQKKDTDKAQQKDENYQDSNQVDTDEKDSVTKTPNQIDTHIANLNDILNAMDPDLDDTDHEKNEVENGNYIDVENQNVDVEENEDDIEGKLMNEKEANTNINDSINFNVEPNISIL